MTREAVLYWSGNLPRRPCIIFLFNPASTRTGVVSGEFFLTDVPELRRLGKIEWELCCRMAARYPGL